MWADRSGMTKLHEITPKTAVEEYISSRHDVAQSTLNNHRYRLEYFVDWAQLESIDSLRDLDGFDLQRYKNWRTNGESAPDCNLVTIEQHLHTLRVFLRWAEQADLVSEGTADKVVIPNVSSQDKARDTAISRDRAKDVIDYLCRYKWASTAHIVFHTLYHCGMRRSGLRALDVSDWHPEERYLDLKHRPKQGTRLKLGERGERHVTVKDERLVDALNDWVENQRPNSTDDYGREPLIASSHGRMHYQSITKICYKVTRPCWIGAECPHDRVVEECEATTYGGYSKCPSSISSHPVRRSSITHHLSKDIPAEICSQRMSLSTKTLDLHYDARDKKQRRQNREQYLDRL